MAENMSEDAIKIPIGVLAQDSVVHANIGQEYIVVTEDKLRLCLVSHRIAFEDKRKWLVPFLAFISVMLVIMTSKFEERFGIDALVWQGVVYSMAFGLVVWTLAWGYTAYRSPDLEDVVSELKKPNENNLAGSPMGNAEDQEVVF